MKLIHCKFNPMLPAKTLTFRSTAPCFQGKEMKWIFILVSSFISLLISTAVSAQLFSPPPPVRTPAVVNVNRKLPSNVLAPDQQLVAHFSANPTDEEIFRVHIFEEPLVPVEGEKNDEDNAAFVSALATFYQRTSQDDFAVLETFLNEYPESRWQGSLLTNLGIVYRKTGYYTKAMDAWQQAWDAMKNDSARRVKDLADRALVELLSIQAWVGRYPEMESLLEEVQDRVLTGPASAKIVSMRESIWYMKNRPEESFKCGPGALSKILATDEKLRAFNHKLIEIKSTHKGFSLVEVQKMADEVGLDYQMAFRKPGSEVILNAVVHWKLDHYSALLQYDQGYYRCSDATMGSFYGEQFWLTPAALDQEASGYFLVPNGTLPKGWQKVEQAEGSKIFGKGGGDPKNDGKYVGNEGEQSPECPPNPSNPMAQSNVHAAVVSLHIADRPVFYTPPIGPEVMWDVHYHQQDTYQPANFTYSNMGPKWTFDWLSYVIDNPANVTANVNIYLQGGGVHTFTGFTSTVSNSLPEMRSSDILARISSSCYELRHADGSKEIYSRSDGSTLDGRKIFLTQKIDAAGNTLNVFYDSNLRLSALKDALGQVTTISYGLADIYKITKVEDPFHRFATFEYDALGRLVKITDVIGIVSSFKYDESDFIVQMTTPYGTTKFSKTIGPGNFRALEITYPLGEKERVEFKENAIMTQTGQENPAVVPGNMAATNNYLGYRNTFFWDKKAMKEAPGDYTKARVYHWLHGAEIDGGGSQTSDILESVKDPLVNRVWYNYEGQGPSYAANQGMSSQPSAIGQVVLDENGLNKSQVIKFTYNPNGTVKSYTDPSNRQLTFTYDANNIDLKVVRQTTSGANDTLAKFTYNSQHLPLTAADASRQKTTFTYNSFGQPLTITNPKNEITTLNYDTNGYLMNITGAIPGSTVSFEYDGFGRVQTITDPEGYKLRVDYDALDRPTLITYHDNTYEQIVYDRLDATHTRDRMGRWSHTVYDSLRRPTIIQDALGRITQFLWCSCGELEAIIDPLNQITSWTRDIMGRVTSKMYPDGKTVFYNYEGPTTSGRLKEVIDLKGQKTQFQYFLDDNLKQVKYTNAAVATPSVSFTYDSKYDRIATMTDTTGTTVYSYNPITSAAALGAGRLAVINGPFDHDSITYVYDSLGRVISRAINNVTSSVVYDKLGRVTSATNDLGSFVYSYLNQTHRLDSIYYPNGQITTFDYFDNEGDQRLKQILNKKGGSTLSKFNYEYNAEGQITKWTQKAGSATANYYEFEYDLADQLASAVLKNQSTSTIVKRFAYNYDKAGNRSSEQIDNSVTSAAHNNINQLTSQSNGGPLRLKGTVNEPAAMAVTNETSSSPGAATVDIDNAFKGSVNVSPGTNIVNVTATDYSGNDNQKIAKYQITAGNGVSRTISYDNNGNTISVQEGSTTIDYTWDAADRLVKITQGDNITEFIYDGLSRRVAEKLNGTVIKRWLWCGTEMCEERDPAGATVTKRFFPQGEQIIGANYYFTRDHLGSVREMTDNSGALKARYDYDPYGRRTLVTGSDLADFGFTGHYYHKISGLHLAVFRAYDANLGRWLNRDPIAEDGGLNLYAYCYENPLNYFDPHGLVRWGQTFWGGVGAAGSVGLLLGLGAISSPVLVVGAAMFGVIGLGLGITKLVAGITEGPENVPGGFGELAGYMSDRANCPNMQPEEVGIGQQIGGYGDMARAGAWSKFKWDKGIGIIGSVKKIPMKEVSPSSPIVRLSKEDFQIGK